MIALGRGYYEEVLGTFPFGAPLRRTAPQRPAGPTRAFIVGVYPSALHALWRGSDGKVLCRALAVGMELHSFWDGTGVEERISELQGRVPKQLGQLEVPHGQFNGPSGRALDTLYLKPLGLKRTECWITDLHDTYYVSVGNAKFLKKYEKLAAGIEGLTPVRFPQKPRLHKVPEERVESLKQEFCQAAPEWVITLGNDPINLIFNGRVGQLELTKYGVPFEAEVFGRRVKALCLCHPRQAAKLGRSSKRWFDAHQGWMKQAQGKGLVTLQE